MAEVQPGNIIEIRTKYSVNLVKFCSIFNNFMFVKYCHCVDTRSRPPARQEACGRRQCIQIFSFLHVLCLLFAIMLLWTSGFA